MKEREKITVEVEVNASIDNTWESFTTEESIIHWNQASDDWHFP